MMLLALQACDVQTDNDKATPVTTEKSIPVTVTRIQASTDSVAIQEAGKFRVGSGLNFEGTAASNDVQLWLNFIFEELAKDIRLEYIPGRRMMIGLNTGEVDVDLARAVDISRGFDNIERVDHPWMHVCSIVVGLAKNKAGLQAETPSILEGGDGVSDNIVETPVIGIFSGSPAMTAAAERYFPDYIVVEYKNDRQAVMLLQHRRVDLIISTHLNWDHLQEMAELPLDIYDMQGATPIYMHIHKKHQARIPEIIIAFKKHADKIAHLSCNIEQQRAEHQLPPASVNR
jgi:ABC-type amino acid transport substrate-binding protein